MEFSSLSNPCLRRQVIISTSKGERAKPIHTHAATAVARAFAAVALLAVLASAQSNDSRNDGKMLRQVATIPTITVTTPADDPFAFVGMPASITAGTYNIKYINNSGIKHNFKIKGSSAVGFQETLVCSKCTNTITVTFTRYIDGVLSPEREYECEPHDSFMKGTVTINPKATTTSTTTVPTITVTTPADKPYAFVGMPASIKAGTYKIKYINSSGIAHNFKIKGNSQKGFQDTPVCSKCTKTITVTFTRFIDGVLSPQREYECEPHDSFMKGTVTITPAT
jgi:hypothetical protein